MKTLSLLSFFFFFHLSFSQESIEKELIIRQKDPQKKAIMIVIEGDNIQIDGKNIDEFKDENLKIISRKIIKDKKFMPFRNEFQDEKSPIFHHNSTKSQAFLGVFTIEDKRGAKIRKVEPESPAEKAGLEKNDIIFKVNKTEILSPDDLIDFIHAAAPEQEITVHYSRENEEKSVKVILAKKPTSFLDKIPPIHLPDFEKIFTFPKTPKLGLKLQDLEEGSGVKIIEIEKESAAEKSGLKVEDVIIEIDAQKISSTDDLQEKIKEDEGQSRLKFKIIRQGKEQIIEVKKTKIIKTVEY